MGYIVFDELDKSASHILLEQVGEYFLTTRKGKTRSRLIIPEPFFVHSNLTTMVQAADLVAYIISWGVRLRHMNEPKREELSRLAYSVMKLRFTQRLRSGRVNYGFKVIPDLRSLGEKKAIQSPAKPPHEDIGRNSRLVLCPFTGQLAIAAGID